MTDDLLEWAIGKTVEEVDQKVAGLKYVTPKKVTQTAPKPLMLVETPEEAAPPPAQMPKVRPDKTRFVTEEVLEYRFAASADFNKALKRAREIARTKGVTGSLEDFMRHVIEFYLDKKDPERQLSPQPREKKPAAKAARPHIPVAVKREVTKRLGYQCCHIHNDGRRCSARAGLHLDHIIPIAKGGAYRDPTNLRWLCPAHNRLAAEIAFGRSFIHQKITAPRPKARHVPQRSGGAGRAAEPPLPQALPPA
jgi:5-methylcytosine-specific restriction endonuclease McrA